MNSPLLIEFVAGTRIHREPNPVKSAHDIPILHNGPPGTFIIFLEGRRVPLPTDQIVFADDASGRALVGFGGMGFAGVEGGQLVFHRLRDLLPENMLSPERGRRMTLELDMVASVDVDGRRIWPASEHRN